MNEIENTNSINTKSIYNKVGYSLFIIGVASSTAEVIIILLARYVFCLSDYFIESNFFYLVLSIISLFLIAYPIGFFMFDKIPSIDYEKKKISLEKFVHYIFMCFPVMYIGNIIGNLLSMVLSNGNAINPLELLEGSNIIVTFVLSVVFAPIAEEYIFRKLIIDRVKKFGEKSAIIFSALAFGLFHMNLFQFFYAFGVGLIFGYIYTRTNDIKYTIFLHMIINFLGGIVAPYIVSLVDVNAIINGAYLSYDFEKLISILIPYLLLLGYLFFMLMSSIIGIIFIVNDRKNIHFELMPEQEGIKNGFRVRYINAGVILFIALCIIFIVLSLLGY